MTEKQLKYQNKVKLISFIIMTAGLLLVLLWSFQKNNAPVPIEDNSQIIIINYVTNGNENSYEYTCINEGCTLSSQSGSFALVVDGSNRLVNLITGESKELQIPAMTKNFMIADEVFYGLVYTKGETNSATFYDSGRDRSMFDDTLNYEAMNTDSVRSYLTRLYPRGLFYSITETSGQLYDIDNQNVVIDNVSGIVVDGDGIYIVSNQGVASFGEDNTLTQHLTNVKKAFAVLYDHQFVVLDSDNNLKLASLTGEVGEPLIAVGERNVKSVDVNNTTLRVVIEDEDFANNQKLHNYEYNFASKEVKTID